MSAKKTSPAGALKNQGLLKRISYMMNAFVKAACYYNAEKNYWEFRASLYEYFSILKP
ncbi:hypothetical protein [Candidatus Nitrosotenuis uzonensis]|uniref:Uncharacterized protein n=1 Tax=Candidatus Nitrosotenuis uzonensis TaxID=1407055 RepID=A0A812F022_9ARCH|nr:hypothetical protein [Candidatus Nitrosotenuis uzonensis]CAE6488090.1 hypothetical protein NUZ5A_20411 [Candidatus Nitrosotenuis uzonensis]